MQLWNWIATFSWSCFLFHYLLPFTALPNITMPIPGTVLRAFSGRLISVCAATGTPPVFTAVVWNATVLANKTNTVDARLYEEGNYYCVATNNYGTDRRVIPVVFIGEDLSCKKKIYFFPPQLLKRSIFSDRRRWNSRESCTQDLQPLLEEILR